MYSASCLSTRLMRWPGVEELQHHVGPADRALGAVQAVELDVAGRCSSSCGTPAVSMAMNVLPSRSKRTSTLSRVVPGTSLTIMRSALGQAVDERALAGVAPADDGQLQGRLVRRRPRLVGRRAASPAIGVEQLRLAAVLLGADAQTARRSRACRTRRPVRPSFVGVGLVGDADDRLVERAQPLGDLLVERHDAVADVDDEEDDGGRVDGELDLPLDVGGEVVDVHDAHAAGVDQFEEAVAGLDDGGDAVAGDAGGRIDDGDAPAGEPVEQRRLADVRPADDRDDRQGQIRGW